MPRRRKNGQDDTPPPVDGGNDEQRTEQSNAGARGDTIRAAVRFIAERQSEIAAIREELNEYKQKHIKGDLGMKLADFAAVFRVSQLEAEDRDQLLDTLKEGFAALSIGGQLDWVAGLQAEDAKRPAPKPGTAVNEAARQAGRTDGMAGERSHEAEWPNGVHGAADYELGYDEGVEQRARASSTF